MKKFLFSLITCLFTVTLFAQTSRPEWLDHPIRYGRQTYESKTLTDESPWTYTIGESLLHSSERTARTRAEQDLQKRLSSDVAGLLTRNLDAYSFSDFSEEMTEELLLKYEEAVNLYVHIKVPGVEYLEYHIEKDTVDGKKGYKVYVLGRYPVEELRKSVDSMNVDKLIESAAKKLEKDEHYTVPKEIESIIRSTIYSEKVELIKHLQETLTESDTE